MSATTIDTSKLRLTFDDEFNSFTSSPDGKSGWQSTLSFSGRAGRNLYYNNEAEYYSDSSVGVNPFSVSNGVLSITARTANTATTPYNLPYTSGAINSKSTFYQQYGYFEARAKVPSGSGLWSAFWLLPQTDTKSTTSELDIFEVLGRDPTFVSQVTHSATDGTNYGYTKTADLSTAFHTYGADWGPNTITFYLDGKAVKTIATPSNMKNPMFMVLNLAVGGAGSWAGTPTGASEFPVSMQVDYVRAYATSNTKTIGGTAAITTSTGGTSTGGSTSGSTTGTTITLGGASATLSKGAGNYTVTGTAGNYTVTLGNGNQTVTLDGWSNDVTVGNGTSVIAAGKGYATVKTGTGTATISAHGNGNLFDAGGTSTMTVDTGSVHNTFVLNAAGKGVATIYGLGLDRYDTLDLTRTLSGASVKSDLSNIGSFITATVASGSTTLYVDTTGGKGTKTAFAVLKNVSTSVDALLKSGDFSIG